MPGVPNHALESLKAKFKKIFRKKGAAANNAGPNPPGNTTAGATANDVAPHEPNPLNVVVDNINPYNPYNTSPTPASTGTSAAPAAPAAGATQAPSAAAGTSA